MQVWLWVGFLGFVIAMLALDLGVFHRRPHEISVREAFAWTGVWVAMAGLFNLCVYFLYEHHILGIGERIGHDISGKQAALQFLTGYLVEKSLSLDNVMVIALIFSHFHVPRMHQHRVLFWGVMGALILRGAMIAGGNELIRRFDWSVYLFGGILFLTAARLLVVRHGDPVLEHNLIVRMARRWIPMTKDYAGHRFFVTVDGKRLATPLFVVLLVVEGSDVLFAVDSIPAIFAITLDPFLVFTSNVFAILGLRSLYFALAGAMSRFRFLKVSLVFVLAFVGLKMILSHHYEIPTGVSLFLIAGILAVGALASLAAPPER